MPVPFLSVQGMPEPSSRALALLLFGLGVLTRFAYLTHPREVIFDEYHFGKFVNGYITGAPRPPR
jgi:dolichyl-phosphate-mannose-protein mannosyltransferase